MNETARRNDRLFPLFFHGLGELSPNDQRLSSQIEIKVENTWIEAPVGGLAVRVAILGVISAHIDIEESGQRCVVVLKHPIGHTSQERVGKIGRAHV